MNLEALFNPRHVAVIGASRTPGKLGHSVLRNLVQGGFAGRISAINPAAVAVEGQPGYRLLADLPEPAECVFLAIPAAAVTESICECAAAGVRFAIVGASGFAELDSEEGRSRQAQISAAVSEGGLRIVGPNTNGILNLSARLSLGYNAAHAQRFEPGTISVVSHSGALMDGIARRVYRAGGGLSKFVAAGNEADLNMLDFLEYLIDDETTRVIGLVIEALSDGPRFRSLAGKAKRAGKPIVGLKIGRSSSGADATLAHSSRLAGSARAYQALFQDAGVASVLTVEALAGACALLAAKHEFSDQRLVCVTTSGAGGAILADFAAERCMPLAGKGKGLWEDAAAGEFAGLPTVAAIRNPIDMGSLGDWRLLDPVFEALERFGIEGPTLVYAHIGAAPGMDFQLADALIQRNIRCPSPVLVLAPGGLHAEVEAHYSRGGIPVFHDTAACFDTLQCWYQAFAAAAPIEEAGSTAASDDCGGTASVIGELLRGRNGILSEARSAEVLRRSGVPMVANRVVHSPDEALQAAAAFAYPVVLKALVPGIAHKNHHALVALGLGDAAALAQAYDAMAARASALGHSKVPCLVQPMVQGKAELIVGVSHEAPLGHFLLAGLGGIHAEMFDQVTLFPIPSSRAALHRGIESARLGRLAPVEDIVTVLEALQALVLAHPGIIESVDVNPLLVSENGCVAVDALIVLCQQQGGA